MAMKRRQGGGNASYGPLKKNTKKNPAVQAGSFVESCGTAMHSGVAAFDQAVGTTFGNTVAIQMIGAVSSNTVAIQVIGAVSGNAVTVQVVRTVSSNTVAVQVIRAISRYTILYQTIGATLDHTAFNQTIRTAFGDNWLSRSSGKSVHCKNRESDAEEGLAFHDGVLRVVMGGYGADVTPWIF
jgi:nucleoside diphosphate kinase